MTEARFTLFTAKHSNDTWGWNGWVLDRKMNTRHSLVKVYVDYELDGEVGYGECAFDTYAEMRAAAVRKAKKLGRAA